METKLENPAVGLNLKQGEAQAAPPRTLTTSKIVGLIVGAATPLAVLVGTIPLGLAFGGPSLTLAFFAAGFIVLMFAVGYVQMVQRITRPGAFYNYIARGAGRPAGRGRCCHGGGISVSSWAHWRLRH